MSTIDLLLVATSAGLGLGGFVMEAAAIRAYLRTRNSVMLPLAIGFALIVAATLSTAALVQFNGFADYRLLLVVQNGIAMVGYLFVVFSVFFYQDG